MSNNRVETKTKNKKLKEKINNQEISLLDLDFTDSSSIVSSISEMKTQASSALSPSFVADLVI